MGDDAPRLRGELRQLSSDGSETRRMLVFVLAGVLTAAALASIVAGKGLPALVLFGVSAALWLVAVFGRLLLVETDGYWLLASDWSKTVWIPLRQVVSVQRVLLFGGDRVAVEVGCDTPFGREIAFEARFELGGLVGQHPVVEELRALVAQAKAARPPTTPGGAPGDDDTRHQGGSWAIPRVFEGVSPARAHNEASPRASGTRWRLSRGRVGSGFRLGCLGVWFGLAAGFIVVHHGPWPFAAFLVLVLIGS